MLIDKDKTMSAETTKQLTSSQTTFLQPKKYYTSGKRSPLEIKKTTY